MFNKISGYKTQTFMWNTEKWKVKNSCLIFKQNVVMSPTNVAIDTNELSNASGL